MKVHYRMNHCDERSCVHNRTQADSAAGTILRRMKPSLSFSKRGLSVEDGAGLARAICFSLWAHS